MQQALRSFLVDKMPHDIARQLYRLAEPRGFQEYQRQRSSTEPTRGFEPFDRHRCIFVHVPKTGGTSIANALFGFLPSIHIPIRTYQLVYSKKEFDSYFKFGFVRNPWDRCVSAYAYLSRGGASKQDQMFNERALAEFSDFDEFIVRWLTPKNCMSYFHFWPQTALLKKRSGKIGVDFVGRFESIGADAIHVANELGPDDFVLPHLNKSTHGDYRSYYSDDSWQRVAEIYKEDIALFGYEDKRL